MLSRRNKNLGWNFAVLCGLSLASLMLELVVVLVQEGGSKLDLAHMTLGQSVWHWVDTCVVWGIAVFLMHTYARKKLGFNLLESKDKPSGNAVLIAFVFLVIATVVMTMAWHGQFKPLAEYRSFVALYGKIGVVAFVFQYIYYLFETLLIVLTISFGQKAGEIIFGRPTVPWGGLACSVLWGVPHLFTKDLLTGVLAFLVAILYGVSYLLMKRNLRFAYPLIFLMFVLWGLPVATRGKSVHLTSKDAVRVIDTLGTALQPPCGCA